MTYDSDEKPGRLYVNEGRAAKPSGRAVFPAGTIHGTRPKTGPMRKGRGGSLSVSPKQMWLFGPAVIRLKKLTFSTCASRI